MISPAAPDFGTTADARREAFVMQREHTLGYLQQLAGDDWLGPQHPSLNPPLWEWLHINWFAEFWCLRNQVGDTPGPSRLPNADPHFNSALLAHNLRWQVRYPDLSVAEAYASYVREAVAEVIGSDGCAAEFAVLAIHHEAMHEENFMRRAQRLRQPFRRISDMALLDASWVNMPEAQPILGAPTDGTFRFDNEYGRLPVSLAPYAIRHTLISEQEFAGFVAEGGYQRHEFWTDHGWQWREQKHAGEPLYWRKEGSEWCIGEFDAERAPAADQPMRHVNAFEAEAFCRYAGARLPRAAEWQHAYPLLQVLPLWEWTSGSFAPYPGFVPGPYAEYSAPSFGHTRELRGHSPLLHPGLCRADFRNFFAPQRRDICAGIRLCRDLG